MKHNQLSNDKLKQLVHYTNSVLLKTSEELSLIPSVPFGPMLGLDSNNVEFAVQKHRFINKFQVPSSEHDDALWDKCMNDWIAHEDNLRDFDLYKSFSHSTPEVRSVIYKARNWIHTIFKKYKFRVVLNDCDLDFTPGATFIPTKGQTSVRQKLLDLKHWTVTYSALVDALELIWNSNALRHMALNHLVSKGIISSDSYWVVFEHENAFKSLVEDHLLTIVNGARGSAVPKDNEKMRFINIEPMFNMLLQRAVALELRRIMKLVGNDLETGQAIHAKMISNLCYATLDLKNASDSNAYVSSEFMAPAPLFSLMDKWRSYTTTIKFKGLKADVEIANFKLSAMGNGFTFEWMSLYLLSICRVLDPTARVYGDDIVVLADKATLVTHCLETLGWSINPLKSFINGSFRESCGAFYHKDTGYITCYDVHFCESISDVILTCNKLRRVMHYHPVLSTAWESLIERMPALLKGPILDHFHGLFIETSGFSRTQKRNKQCAGKWKKYGKLLWTAQQLWQKTPLAVVTSFEFKSQTVCTAASDVTETCDIGFYLFAGRKTADVLRGKGRWRKVDLVVFDDNSVCRLSEIRRVLRGITSAAKAIRGRRIDYKLNRYINESTICVRRAA